VRLVPIFRAVVKSIGGLLTAVSTHARSLNVEEEERVGYRWR
jgi:hypothetical protein